MVNEVLIMLAIKKTTIQKNWFALKIKSVDALFIYKLTVLPVYIYICERTISNLKD